MPPPGNDKSGNFGGLIPSTSFSSCLLLTLFNESKSTKSALSWDEWSSPGEVDTDADMDPDADAEEEEEEEEKEPDTDARILQVFAKLSCRGLAKLAAKLDLGGRVDKFNAALLIFISSNRK